MDEKELARTWCKNNLIQGEPKEEDEKLTILYLQEIIENISQTFIDSVDIFEVLKELYPKSLSHEKIDFLECGWKSMIYLKNHTTNGRMIFRRLGQINKKHHNLENEPIDEAIVELKFLQLLTDITIFTDYDVRAQYKIKRPGKNPFAVDYAILSEGRLYAIIECKRESRPRDGFGQLYEYLTLLKDQGHQTPIGIWTNGEKYAQLSLKEKGFEVEFLELGQILFDKLNEEFKKILLQAASGNISNQEIIDFPIRKKINLKFVPRDSEKPKLRYFKEHSGEEMRENNRIWDESFKKIIFYHKNLQLYQRKNCLHNDINRNPNKTILAIRFPGEDFIKNDKIIKSFQEGKSIVYDETGNVWKPKEIWIYNIIGDPEEPKESGKRRERE